MKIGRAITATGNMAEIAMNNGITTIIICFAIQVIKITTIETPTITGIITTGLITGTITIAIMAMDTTIGVGR